MRSPVCLSALFAFAAATAAAQQPASAPQDTFSLLAPMTQTEALVIADGIYQATGFGNTFLVRTQKGNVIIDTSLERTARRHKELLDAVDDAQPSYIIVTHGHADHIGGVATWAGEQTEVIAQENLVEFLHYQSRLSGFFGLRNAAQFGLPPGMLSVGNPNPGNFEAEVPATILVSDRYELDMGDLTFEILAMPSETHDALVIWVPERKAVFVGDLFYESFPNMYTLRGTKPRWALDYVDSLNRVLNLQAEILIPSHGEPIQGTEQVRAALERYRDAILYVHDATVRGMNAGESVDTLVQEIRLPEALALPEIYGRVDWSVRGIYEGYVGWFDGDPSTMLGIEPAAAAADLVSMAGGPDAVGERAAALLRDGQTERALALADVVLVMAPCHRVALETRRAALESFDTAIDNFNASGWLRAGVRDVNRRLTGDCP